MSKFEEALRAILLGENAGFQIADADLHREVTSAAAAVENISGGTATLVLQPAEETEHELVYRLLVRGEDHEAEAGAFSVGRTGYPILASPAIELLDAPKQRVRLATRESIADYLASLASNPDSSLINQIAYLMKRPKAIGAET